MKSKAFWMAFVMGSAVSPSFADKAEYQFSREIKSPPLKQEELLGIRVDPEIFAATRDGLPDVRILDRRDATPENYGSSTPSRLLIPQPRQPVTPIVCSALVDVREKTRWFARTPGRLGYDYA